MKYQATGDGMSHFNLKTVILVKKCKKLLQGLPQILVFLPVAGREAFGHALWEKP